MKKSVLVTLPTAVLWEFREFKSEKLPTSKIATIPISIVDEVMDHITTTGKIEPLELSVIGNRALLTDGNHRIVAAKRLGYKMVPVYLIVYFGDGPHPFYEHTLKRFKPISDYLELWLKRTFL
jgi:hypothetical protein